MGKCFFGGCDDIKLFVSGRRKKNGRKTPSKRNGREWTRKEKRMRGMEHIYPKD